MNEQIKELERQCWQSTQTEPYALFDAKKFAELIVQECLTICQHNAEDDDDQFDLGRVHQAKEITHLIKKHFGVAE